MADWEQLRGWPDKSRLAAGTAYQTGAAVLQVWEREHQPAYPALHTAAGLCQKPQDSDWAVCYREGEG